MNASAFTLVPLRFAPQMAAARLRQLPALSRLCVDPAWEVLPAIQDKLRQRRGLLPPQRYHLPHCRPGRKRRAERASQPLCHGRSSSSMAGRGGAPTSVAMAAPPRPKRRGRSLRCRFTPPHPVKPCAAAALGFVARVPQRLQKFPGDGMAAAGAAPPRFSDADIDRDPGAAAQELTTALEKNPDDAEYYCQRAYAHILLQKYADAVADAKKSLELNPSNAVALLRKGLGEYHIKNYASALESFREGQRLDNVDDTFTIWIKRCEETLNASQTEMQPLPPKIKYDWYQTDSQVIVTIMIKNAQKDDVSVQFSEKEMNASVRLASGEDYNLKLVLLHSIVPEQSTFKVLSTKVEIKMKKPEAVRWEKLEGQGDSPKLKQFTPDTQHLYPSSSHYTRNWDKLVVEIKEEEKNEKLEGDAALNKLFQQIYSDGTDEVKRAMNKSFMESGGTVLSTNWSDVGKRKVEVNPPDDMEWKKF
ncbi:protein SGT1 homolog isoform X2 [Grus americana]|uniref:protein SGT1 homolog isoform X2 n=1 Tax=Grus americana TaxID=9117 RepID=UPI0024082E62|nr:protein SGT1 homolog isoform X2 [Grus americana]